MIDYVIDWLYDWLIESFFIVIQSVYWSMDCFGFHRSGISKSGWLEFLYVTGILVDLAVVQKDLEFMDENSSATHSLPVSPVNFLLGIGDLTGELMRYSIKQASNPNAQKALLALCEFARAVLIEYQRIPYGVAGKDYGIKLNVMRQSVFKIERVCYQLALRHAENLPALPASFLKVDTDGPPDDAAERF